MRISWDAAKEAANRRKHGLSFDEAGALFSSADYLEIFDDAHSETEDRFIAVGMIGRGLIVVVWTPPEEDTVHIISARFATKREEALYEAHIGRRDDRTS